MISLIFYIFFIATCIQAAAQNDWALKKDKDGVVIYTSAPEDDPLKKYLVSAEIRAPIVRVYDFLTDLEHRPEWVINCMGLEIIDTNDGKIRYHTSYDIPWPLADRDLVVEARFSLAEDTSTAHLLTSRIDLEYDLDEGMIRMPGYREEVHLEVLSPDKILFRAEGFADPGGKVPAWIVNLFLVDGIYNSVVRTRESVVLKEKLPGRK